MSNMPDIPFAMTGTAGSSGGKNTASITPNARSTNYTCFGDTPTLATLALAERLVMEGFDPTTKLTVGAVVLQDIEKAI